MEASRSLGGQLRSDFLDLQHGGHTLWVDVISPAANTLGLHQAVMFFVALIDDDCPALHYGRVSLLLYINK